MSEEERHTTDAVLEHEGSDVNVRAILGFGAALLAVTFLVQIFLYWLMGAYGRQAERRETRVFPLAAEQQEQQGQQGQAGQPGQPGWQQPAGVPPYAGQFYPGPHKFDLEMQTAAFDWLKAQLIG